MVGGRVIEVVWQCDRIFVDTHDMHNRNTRAIWVERNANSEHIDLGDLLWWRGDTALWTPSGGSAKGKEIEIPKLGPSGVYLDRTAAIGL